MNSNLRLLGGLFVFTVATSIHADAHDTAKAAMESARQKGKASDFAGAVKDADEAIRLSSANTLDRINAILFKAELAEKQKDFAKAYEQYDRVISDPESPLPQKLIAINKKVAALRTEKKHDEAKAAYLAELDGGNFKMESGKEEILLAIGRLYTTDRHFAKAAEYFEKAAHNEGAAKLLRINALKSLGQALVADARFAEARKHLGRILTIADVTPTENLNAALDIAASFEAEGDFAKAEAEYVKALQIEGLNVGNRKYALTQTAAFYKNRANFDGFTRTLAALREIDKTVDAGVLRNYALVAEATGRPDVEEAAWSEILSIPAVQGRSLLEPVSKKINLLAARRDVEGIKQLANDLSTRTLTNEQKAFVTLLAAGLSAPGGDLAKFQAPSLEPLDATQQANAYFEVGKVMMRMKNTDGARFFAEKANGMFEKSEARVYDCQFMEQAPRGVSGWESSPIVKDASRREDRFEEYNKQAAAFLINDVNVARNITTDDSQKKAPVRFYMAADSLGWHVYLQYQDDKAEEVLAGLVGGGELEMYVAPGMSNAYYQFMVNVPSGNVNYVAWSSPHKGYRKLNSYLQSQVSPIDGGFGVYLCFPWELLYDKLPQEGNEWPFGIVNFGRAGAFTWGSGQVHELSRFGKVRFSGIDKARPAIHRWIAMKAYAKYKKSAADAKVIWNDREKGDSAFFETVLQPQISILDELGKLVSSKMPEGDSEMLFQEAVPTWMEFDFWVSEMRARYLSDKLMAQ